MRYFILKLLTTWTVEFPTIHQQGWDLAFTCPHPDKGTMGGLQDADGEPILAGFKLGHLLIGFCSDGTSGVGKWGEPRP